MSIDSPPLWVETSDPVYNAREYRRMLRSLLRAQPGVLGRDDLRVTERGAGANMSVDVWAGGAAIAGTENPTQGFYYLHSGAVANLAVQAAPGIGQSRNDLVVARVRDAEYSGSDRLAELTIVAGTPAATGSQTDPAVLPPNTQALARVTVGENQTSVTAANITDLRSLTGPGSWAPPATIVAYTGAVAPSGWVWCAGQAISRSQHPWAFAVVGTTYGAGDGSSTFQVPDLRGRVPVGLDNMGGAGDAGRLSAPNVLGGSGGAETVVLSVGQLPSHDHPVNDPGHNHREGNGLYQFIVGETGPSSLWLNSGAVSAGIGRVSTTLLTDTRTTGVDVLTTGSGEAHPNMPPYLLVGWIMRV